MSGERDGTRSILGGRMVPNSSHSESLWNGALKPAGAAAGRPGEGSTTIWTAKPQQQPGKLPG